MLKRLLKKKYRKILLDDETKKNARLLALVGEETRIRIMCFMFEYDEACVTDIAKSLGVPINTISHHLRILKDNNVLIADRMGTSICYKLASDMHQNKKFIKNLERMIC